MHKLVIIAIDRSWIFSFLAHHEIPPVTEQVLTFEFTGLRGFSRRSGGMMGWAAHSMAKAVPTHKAFTYPI
jgi:hypothetical protein